MTRIFKSINITFNKQLKDTKLKHMTNDNFNIFEYIFRNLHTSGQCSFSIFPENIRKTEVFLCFFGM